MPSRDFTTMFPQILDTDMIVSQSTVASLELSPCRWYYKPERRKPSEPMFFGTVTHHQVESFLAGRLNDIQLLDPNLAWTASVDLATDDGFDLYEALPSEEQRAKFSLEISDASSAWLRDYWHADGNQNLAIKSVEEPFAMDITPAEGVYPEGRKVWFVTGGIDLLLEDWKIIDWKTASVMWSKGKGTALGQKEAYAMLVDDKYGVMPTSMTFWVYDRARKLWGPRPADITPYSVAAYRARVEGWVQYMLNPFHLCTPSDGKVRGWWSKPQYNDVWDLCPSCRHLGDSWDKKERKADVW